MRAKFPLPSHTCILKSGQLRILAKDLSDDKIQERYLVTVSTAAESNDARFSLSEARNQSRQHPNPFAFFNSLNITKS